MSLLLFHLYCNIQKCYEYYLILIICLKVKQPWHVYPVFNVFCGFYKLKDEYGQQDFQKNSVNSLHLDNPWSNIIWNNLTKNTWKCLFINWFNKILHSHGLCMFQLLYVHSLKPPNVVGALRHPFHWQQNPAWIRSVPHPDCYLIC